MGRIVLREKLTVLIVGGGGREHAIAWKLAQSPRLGRLYAAPGNAGMAELAVCESVAVDDVAGQVELARRIDADLVVVGPELPLSLGLVDELQRQGISAVGPTRAAARIESSKQFAKDVMEAAGIPTAPYRVVGDFEQARSVVFEYFHNGGFRAGVDVATRADKPDDGGAGAVFGGASPLVVKADGLAGGKGVVICHSEEEALTVARDMLAGRRAGGAGTTLVLEQFLHGPEVSLLAFCDGRRAVPMPLVQDYKRLLTGDRGPNTGGMGSVSPVPDVERGRVPGTEHAACDAEELAAVFVAPLLEEMSRRGTPFRGILFAGLMLTPHGPMALEYNARFGDPETQSVLRRLDSDLLELLLATATGDLSDAAPKWSSRAACCVVVASEGYPDDPERGVVIDGVPPTGTRPASAPASGHRPGAGDERVVGGGAAVGGGTVDGRDAGDPVIVFHGSTARNDAGELVSNGGRVLSVTATGADIGEAVEAAYAAVKSIRFPGAQYRTDIGRR